MSKLEFLSNHIFCFKFCPNWSFWFGTNSSSSIFLVKKVFFLVTIFFGKYISSCKIKYQQTVKKKKCANSFLGKKVFLATTNIFKKKVLLLKKSFFLWYKFFFLTEIRFDLIFFVVFEENVFWWIFLWRMSFLVKIFLAKKFVEEKCLVDKVFLGYFFKVVFGKSFLGKKK